MQIAKIYLSASQQPLNKYAANMFSEEEVMHALIHLEEPLFKKLGYQVKLSDPKKTMNDNINEANTWIKKMPNGRYEGIYIAHHSNAFKGKNDGTLGLHYPSTNSKLLTQYLYNEIAKVTPSSDEGLRAAPELAELRKTNMPASLIEYFYHDNVSDMKAGLLNLQQLAEATVRGAYKFTNTGAVGWVA